MNTLLRDARAYLARGWSVIPVVAKRPLVRTWKPYTRCRATDAELVRWFSDGKATGVAVLAGAISGGLAVRDFDKPGSYEAWAKKHPALARTLPTVRTGRGHHVYCRSDLAKIITLADGEYRGAGICIAPHSRHPAGSTYKWIIPLPDGPLPEVTHTVLQLQHSHVTEPPEHTETPEQMASVCSVVSVTCNRTLTIDDAIRLTLPKGPGERNHCILRLARALKFDCQMADTPLPKLKPIVRRWYERAKPTISTQDFDTTWSDFIHAWPRARAPLSGDALTDAWRRGQAEMAPEADGYDSPPVQQLVTLCANLARPDGEFYLSSHSAAGLLAREPTQVLRWVAMLVTDGLLEVKEKGRQGRATRYRWLGTTVAQDAHSNAQDGRDTADPPQEPSPGPQARRIVRRSDGRCPGNARKPRSARIPGDHH